MRCQGQQRECATHADTDRYSGPLFRIKNTMQLKRVASLHLDIGLLHDTVRTPSVTVAVLTPTTRRVRLCTILAAILAAIRK